MDVTLPFLRMGGQPGNKSMEPSIEEPVKLMKLPAFLTKVLISPLEIPGGTLHAGQEIEFTRAISIGENLRCSATLLQNSVRGDWRFVVVQLQVEDSGGSRVMNGKSTIMLQI